MSDLEEPPGPANQPLNAPINERRAELIAAAVHGDLSVDERAELDALRVADTRIDAEINELRALAGRVSTLGTWQSAEPSDQLRRRIAAIGHEAPAAAPTADAAPTAPATAPAPAESIAPITPLRPRRRPALLALGAAASLAIGLGLGLGIPALQSMPPTGPAGTLGAIEAVDFAGEPTGARVDGELIAHTWGIESVLEIDGVAPGDSFSVVVIGLDGAEYDSGTFLGSDVVIHCRMNAAVLREQVAAVEVRTATGETIAAAEVPAVAG